MTESGRSMVEMLGVLAVMGVLSVAGIAGFNSAMNRHRANELLNEANKRATVVAAQAMQGRSSYSIDEFGNNTINGSTLAVIPVGKRQFAITITKLKKDVCQNIKNSIGNNSPIRRMTLSGSFGTNITSCSGTKTYALVYNNDLSTKDLSTKDAEGNCLQGYQGTDCTQPVSCSSN